MFYGDNIQDTRGIFFQSWKKYRQNVSLSPLEQQVVTVILEHPEYHTLLEENSSVAQQTYFPELGQTNPFLHLGLHLAVRDQINTDRPPGIAKIYQQLLLKLKDKLVAEHLMMEYLAECLWQAQKNLSIPNEASYISHLKEALG